MSVSEGKTERTAERVPLSRDDLYEVLSNRRRRHVIRYLQEQEDRQAELSEVVEWIAALENGTDVEQLSYDDRKSVHISLYQHHAPKMDEAGVIEYDERAGTLRLTDEAADLDAFLDPPRDPTLPWGLYFLSLSVVATVVVAVGWVTPVTEVVSGVVVLAFLVSSVAFLYDERYRGADVGGTGEPSGDAGD